MVASEREAVARAVQEAWSVECSDVQIEDDEAGRIADAVLSALSALSDRSRSEVGGDVVERAVQHIMGNRRDVHLQLAPCRSTVVTDYQVKAVIEAALPILAADAERRVREECAQIFSRLHNLPGENAMSIFRKIRGDIDPAPYPDLKDKPRAD